MPYYICNTCGVQHAQTVDPPNSCLICEDERQYIHPNGQTWTTLEDMREKENLQNILKKEEDHLYSIKTEPEFAIGQTAHLIQHKGFNVLWDCISYLDQRTIDQINESGGIQAIALSHPHYYSTQVEWAEAFQAPIYIHEDDKKWVTRPSNHIHFWSGETLSMKPGLDLYRLGGHFKGGAVLHWSNGNKGKGCLLTGDIITVTADQNWVSFMYSYPNLIPLPAYKVEEIAAKVKPLQFNRLYNAFSKVVKENAGEAVQRSAIRYIKALNSELFHT
ncbi:hypothetical protein FUA19_04500 [Bacillus subtilis]|uniref:MBL fold metallo-hydrolase n=1 Tax=Bacillus sp. LJBS06 TaxID=2809036 RepID=UPI0011C8A0B7|nr:hypothetical protein [Bacillus sp. LJBS06]QRZ94716.1 hypothetical protein JQX68_09620 [Bacillus sp. LJBS06]TXF72538.1 hypothetical protein FUA19_04500 [Bacillus subtilis]